MSLYNAVAWIVDKAIMNSVGNSEANTAVQRQIEEIVKLSLYEQISPIESIAKLVLDGKTEVEISFLALGTPEILTKRAAFTALKTSLSRHNYKLAASIAREFELDRGEVLVALGDPLFEGIKQLTKSGFQKITQEFNLSDDEKYSPVIERFRQLVESSEGLHSSGIIELYCGCVKYDPYLPEVFASILKSHPEKILAALQNERINRFDLKENLLPLIDQAARLNVVASVECDLLKKFTSLITRGQYGNFEHECYVAESTFGVKWAEINSEMKKTAAKDGVDAVVSNLLKEGSHLELGYEERALLITSALHIIEYYKKESGLEYKLCDSLLQIFGEAVDDRGIIVCCQFLNSLGKDLGYLGAEPARILIAEAKKLNESQSLSTNEVNASFTDLVASLTASTHEIQVRERVSTMLALSESEDIDVVRKLLSTLDYPLFPAPGKYQNVSSDVDDLDLE